MYLIQHVMLSINPLSANLEYNPQDTMDTSNSCNPRHSENYDKDLTFS